MPDGGHKAFPSAVAVTVGSAFEELDGEFVIVAGSPLGGRILIIAEVKSNVL